MNVVSCRLSMLKLFEHILHSQAQKNTSSTKYPFPSTIIPATCEITANPRFWIDCILKEQIKTKSTCKYFAVEKVIVCFASLLHMTLEKKASLNKIKTSEHLIEECVRPSKCPAMESQMVQNSRNKIDLTFKQICYQGHKRIQSSSTKSIHVQPILSQGQDI